MDKYAVYIISSAHDVMKIIFAVLCVSLNEGFTHCYKTTVFYFNICSFSISSHSWDTTSCAFTKQTNAV